MKVSKIIELLNAKVLCLPEAAEETEIHSACGSDMMSDVLAYVKDQGLLLTGLMNPQVVRTAEMMDISAVAFCRGKVPDESITALAKAKGIVILSTNLRLYQACGVLYKNGLDAEPSAK